MPVTYSKMSAYEKTNYRCAHCGRSDVPLTVEHIFPQSLFADDISKDNEYNLTILCKRCNQEKNDELIHPSKFKSFYKHILPKHIDAYMDTYLDNLWQIGTQNVLAHKNRHPSNLLKSENKQLQNENDMLRTNNIRYKEENKKLKVAMASLKTENKTIRSQLSEQDNMIAKLKATISIMFRSVTASIISNKEDHNEQIF